MLMLGLWVSKGNAKDVSYRVTRLLSGAPLTDGKRPRDCALIGTLYIWECVRSTGKEMKSRETSVEQVSFSNVRSCLV